MKWSAESHLKKAMWFSVGMMALAPIEGQATGQCVEQKILASDRATGGFLDNSVSISGDPGNEVVIIGVQWDFGNRPGSGAAYIYRKNGENWIQEARLIASDGASLDSFGSAVSISSTRGNDVAIIGARWNDDHGSQTGSAYIFRFNPATSEWVQEAKLLASDGASTDLFGVAVSISGSPGNEVAIVGAIGDDDNSRDSGSAYIFRFNPDTSEWIEESKLTARDPRLWDRLGISVSIISSPGNEVATVGVAKDNRNAGTWSGAVNIYRRTDADWVQEATLRASRGTPNDQYGKSVSVSGPPGNEFAIVGAHLDNANGTFSGSAYIYRFNPEISGWVEETKLLASNGAEGDRFGTSVSISVVESNKVVIVGAWSDDDNGTDSGSAYIYRFNSKTSGWVEETKLLASDGAEGDRFGTSVSISGANEDEVAIVGAKYDSGNGLKKSSAYIFDLICGPACPADLNGDGIVDVLDLFRVIQALFTRGDVPEDLDGDGVVTFRDVHIVIQSFGSCDDSNPESCPADLNGDGIVDVHDLLLLLGSWGPCSTPCLSDLNGDGSVNVSDFLQLLAAWGPCP